MTRSISSVAASSQNGLKNSVQPRADSPKRVFTRNAHVPAADSQSVPTRPHDPGRPEEFSHLDMHSADATGARSKLNYMVFRNGRLQPENTRQVTHVPRIPAPARPDSKELRILRIKAQDLLGKMNRAARPHGGSGVPFETHRGEKAVVSLDRDGAVTISRSGRPEVKMFRDAHDRQNVHILMRGPDERMHAGRNLPSDYVVEATRLINSALFNARS